MARPLAQKTLSDGATLQLAKYQLDKEGAAALRRPVGSNEVVLTLTGTTGNGEATVPEASWYASEREFRGLYDRIRTENDFRRVGRELCATARSSDPANVRSLLETLAQHSE